MKQTTLEETSEFITDGTHGSPKRTENSDGIPLLSAKNVFDGEVRWDNFDLVPRSELEEFQKRVRLKKGDVLMTCVGTIGRAAVWMNERPVVFFRSVAIIRPKSGLLPEYLECIIRSDDFQEELRRRTKRSSQGGVYLKDIKSMPVVVPRLAEQERIVKLLDEADELRKLRAQADRRTADLIPALFHEMFGDPGMNPREWPVATLGSLITDGPQNGLYKHSSAYGDGTRILRIDGFYDGSVSDVASLQRLRLNVEEIRKYSLRPWDIVINRVNSPQFLGKSALIPTLAESVVFESNMMRFGVNQRLVNVSYLIFFLQTTTIRQQIASKAKHAIHQSSINQEDVKSLRVLLPPIELQHKFASTVVEIRDSEAKQAASRERLDSLFQSMLHRAFRGEL